MNKTPSTAIVVLAEALPDGRSLTIAECAEAAAAAAKVYDLDALVEFEQGERTYTQLWRTAYSEAYAIGWKQAADTGFHDHDGSVGSVHVVRGTVAEEHIVLRPSGDWLARVEFATGETFRFDGAHIHRMRHAAGEIALTVHVYSPPLGRAGAYELSPDGTLRRHSIAGDEELRASESFQERRSVEDPPDARRGRSRRLIVLCGVSRAAAARRTRPALRSARSTRGSAPRRPGSVGSRRASSSLSTRAMRKARGLLLQPEGVVRRASTT